ncbi:granulin [Teladorsagia circumcincta]|uniref:Granulin n=1 Tax=Teladorsagia circumcincta TaxID=45464 RepID=A0A2G9UM97_TELCI|nr:granulin [Teladorsagia circumcincta]
MKHPRQEDEMDELAPISCGHQTICPALTTCCEVFKNGEVRNMCCPLQDAVCCEDTCCPAGYHCRSNGRCEKRAVRDFFGDFAV